MPLTCLSQKDKDRNCFGVISNAEDDTNNRETIWGTISTVLEKENGDTRYFINSVGEGSIWISNKNGPIESGEYITTSSIPGYGQKQDDDLLHNYTVAKITMDCNFNPGLQYVKQVVRQNIAFTQDNSGNYTDMNGNILYQVDEYGVKTKINTSLNYHFDISNNIGVVLYKLGRFLEASTMFEQAITFNNKYIPAYENLALTQKLLGNYELSINYILQGLKLMPNNNKIKNYLIDILNYLEPLT